MVGMRWIGMGGVMKGMLITFNPRCWRWVRSGGYTLEVV